MISTKMGGIIAPDLIAGAFISSPELRAYAANTLGSADIINNSILSADIKDGEVKTVDLGGNAVTAAKIKDGEVKAAEIAADAVGASEIAANAVGDSEIAGVTKLLFEQCFGFSGTDVGTGGIVYFNCLVKGATAGEMVIATVNKNGCLAVYDSHVYSTNIVNVMTRNGCPFDMLPVDPSRVSIIVFNIF